MTSGSVTRCTCCGGEDLAHSAILWPGLVAEWELTPEETAYIDRQQGFHCRRCGSNLRSMALARAILDHFRFRGTFADFVENARVPLQVLEINEAGQLTQFLCQLPGHVMASFPDVDMQALPFADGAFDLVVHSDTLEHVPEPVKALAECRRVMTVAGATCFTVPIVVGRMTRDRQALAPSYHGSEADPVYLVRTEYGADAWTQVFLAGFDECRLTCLEFPAGLAVTALRRHSERASG